MKRLVTVIAIAVTLVVVAIIFHELVEIFSAKAGQLEDGLLSGLVWIGWWRPYGRLEAFVIEKETATRYYIDGEETRRLGLGRGWVPDWKDKRHLTQVHVEEGRVPDLVDALSARLADFGEISDAIHAQLSKHRDELAEELTEISRSFDDREPS